MSEQANRYAVIGLATSLAGCILGIILVRLFGHDEPTFLIQLAMVIASGLIGYIGGQAATPVRRPTTVTPAPAPTPRQPDTLPTPAPLPTGPNRDKASPTPTLDMATIITRHS